MAPALSLTIPGKVTLIRVGSLDWLHVLTYEEQVVPHEVYTVSLPERSVELDTGAGCNDTLFVLFSLLAVRTLQHGEGAATRLWAHTDTDTQTQTFETFRWISYQIPQDYINLKSISCKYYSMDARPVRQSELSWGELKHSYNRMSSYNLMSLPGNH